MTNIDFVDVMSNHYPFTWSGPEQTRTCEAGVCHGAVWPCLPYQLAEAAYLLKGKVLRVELLADNCFASWKKYGNERGLHISREIRNALAELPSETKT